MLDARILNAAVDVVLGRSSDPKFTAEQRADGFREYLKELSKDYNRNVILINEIIEETVSTVLPIKVTEKLGIFADIATVADGVTKKFHVKNGKITAAYTGLGVEQPRQKLYKGSLSVTTSAIGGAVYAEYEDLVCGRVDFSEMSNMLVDAIMDKIYMGIQDTLVTAFGGTNNANRFAESGLTQTEFDKLMGTVMAYGQPTIVGTWTGLAGLSNASGFDWAKAPDADKIDVRNMGYVAKYKSANVILLPNSFTDETNVTKVIDDGYKYIIPVGVDKPVKIVLEGKMHIKDNQERDWSTTKAYYQKAGISVLAVNSLALHENTAL